MTRLSDPVEYVRDVMLRKRRSRIFDERDLDDMEASAHFTIGPRASSVERETTLSSRVAVVPHAKQGLEDFAEECLERWWEYVARERLCVTVPPERSDTVHRDPSGYFTIVEWRGHGRKVRE